MINKIKGIIRALSFNVDKLAEEIIWYGEKKKVLLQNFYE